MAINLPKHAFSPTLEFASSNYSHSNPKFREASVTALVVISECCFELLKDRLKNTSHIVLAALKDHEQMVRGAASFPLGQFAQHLQPEILSDYSTFCEDIAECISDVGAEASFRLPLASSSLFESMCREIESRIRSPEIKNNYVHDKSNSGIEELWYLSYNSGGSVLESCWTKA